MLVKKLRELLEGLPDNTEVYVYADREATGVKWVGANPPHVGSMYLGVSHGALLSHAPSCFVLHVQDKWTLTAERSGR